MSLSSTHMKRYRAVILNLLETNHRSQKSRMDHIMLAMSMRDLGCGVGEYDVLTLLQDLCDRGYVRYDEKKNRLTNDTEISRIEITSAGRDVLEETKKDGGRWSMTSKAKGSKSARRVRTGEKRKANQPLKIDRLPSEVQERILQLRNGQGKTWLEIEELSAEPFPTAEDPRARGFVDWLKLPFAVLELFPDMRLPHTTLHRWYDIRVAQVQQDVLVRSRQAQTIAKAFAKSNVADGDEAVINAARDTLMSILSEDGTASGRINATKGLLKLSEVMSKVRTNDIRERIVSVDERRVAQLEKDAELKRSRFQKEMDAAEKKVSKGEPMTIADINQIRMRVFGIGPDPAAANG